MAFITIKRKTVIIILSLILAAIGVSAVAATVVIATRADNGITVVIDAGHGGADGGVVGAATGTKESDVNLSIAKYLKKYLSDAGYNVVMTRSDGGAVSGGLKYSKQEDMKARKEIVESAAPDLVVSIHCNSYPMESVSGAQVFYASDSASGQAVADTIQGYFNDALNVKSRSAAVGDYYILNCTEYTSVLCECGFLTNREEESKLISASYQQKIAYTIFTALGAVLGDEA